MIHEPLMEMLKAKHPELTWTINRYTQNDNTGTVYDREGDGAPRYESTIYRPAYQILIRSSDLDKAEYIAYEVRQLLHNLTNVVMTAFLYVGGEPIKKLTVEVMLLENFGGILNLGNNDQNVREYSINFDATLNLLSEEEL